ncbi:MAG TPA: flagellin [Hyphomicrobiaceae bacterium]|nr:flagellin [Hyphomicrobiaceae bacterium]
MSSINTNVAAMTALQTLTQTNKELTQAQTRISTGLRVADAADNAAYWSIATTMRSDNAALSTVRDALGLGAATVDVAYTGLNSAIKVVDEIKSKLVAARQPGVDRAKIQSEINELQAQLQGTADAATFQGQNWLSVDSSAPSYNATQSIVSSFTRAGGVITIGTIAIDITATELYDANDQSGIIDRDRTVGATTFKVSTLDISALTDSAADIQTLEDYITGVDEAITDLTDAATTLGAAKSRVSLQQDFVKSLMDAIDRGIGQLVDADMNEESTRLQALQVKQQLGIQALSIANSSSQSILRLFQ